MARSFVRRLGIGHKLTAMGNRGTLASSLVNHPALARIFASAQPARVLCTGCTGAGAYDQPRRSVGVRTADCLYRRGSLPCRLRSPSNASVRACSALRRESSARPAGRSRGRPSQRRRRSESTNWSIVLTWCAPPACAGGSDRPVLHRKAAGETKAGPVVRGLRTLAPLAMI